MQVTPPQLAYWRKRQREQHERHQRLAQRARVTAAQVTAMLVREFRATRVILFGSLARGRFHDESDIDLAVEGIAPADFFKALAQANELADCWVDLKPLEKLEPRFLRRVLDTGEVLYAKAVAL